MNHRSYPVLYRLNGQTPVTCTLAEWGAFISGHRQHHIVAEKIVHDRFIRTFFHGVDFNFFNCIPELFKTVTYAKDGSTIECNLCSTWEEAEDLHRATVEIAESRQHRDYPNYPQSDDLPFDE